MSLFMCRVSSARVIVVEHGKQVTNEQKDNVNAELLVMFIVHVQP
jgi:hypothetical protein